MTAPVPVTPAEAEAARFAADLIRMDTTNRGGGDGRERPAAEYVAARLRAAAPVTRAGRGIARIGAFRWSSDGHDGAGRG